MKSWGALLFAALSACSFDPRGAADPTGDAVLPPDACTSFSTQLDICTQPAGDDLTLQGMNRFDTGSGALTDGAGTAVTATVHTVMLAGGIQVEALFVRTLTLESGAQLRGVGSRPLAIIASREVVLHDGALIDVGAGGAGARLICPGAPGRGQDSSGGAGGGGGGAFGGAGGGGGNGNSDAFISDTPGGAGGTAATQPSELTGGCPGGAGGVGDDPGGAAGLGGGAIYIAAGRRIELDADAGITAGGGGGGGGERGNGGDAGGGGGGSGGMIILESPQIHSAGFVAANGGGGGAGSGNDVAGLPGAAAITANRATGGNPGPAGSGAAGGLGGGGGVRAGEKTTDYQPGGGGGGGGGVGFIHVLSAEPQIPTISPSAS